MAFALPFAFMMGTSPAVESRWRATTLLLRFSGSTSKAAGLGEHRVNEEVVTSLTSPSGKPLRARLYVPDGVVDPPGLVMVHGIHRLGVDEPRLRNFARSMASAGVMVLTPHVDELADYRVDPASLDTISASTAWLASRVSRAKVGVMGLSFAGGLSVMLAAEHPANIAFAVSVGGHHDMARVLRFLVTNEVDAPEGRSTLTAHGYGLLVFAYSHADKLFPTDAERTKELLRVWLYGDPEAAKRGMAALEPRARATMDLLVRHDNAGLLDAMNEILAAEREVSLAASPRGRLGTMEPKVFLLHGATDDVIPESESRWIWGELPENARGTLLVSRALGHVELKGTPTTRDQLELVELMAGILREAWAEKHRD